MFGQLFCTSSGALDCVLQLVVWYTHDVADRWPATSWVHYTTSCNSQSSVPEDGRNHRPKHVELRLELLISRYCCIWLVVYIIYINDAHSSKYNEIYLLIKYIKSILWGVVKRLSYIQDARCLKFKRSTHALWKWDLTSQCNRHFF